MREHRARARSAAAALLLAALGLSGVAHADVGVWTSGGPYNAWPTALAIDPSSTSTIYAGTFDGMFKSTDAGATWTPANSGLLGLSVATLAIDPITTSTVYAVTDGSVRKSIDSGGTWSLANTGLTTLGVQALAIDPKTPSTLYVGTYGGGVFKSTDSGGTWTAVVAGLTDVFVNALAIDPKTPSTLYAGTYSGAFRSTDSGATWVAAGSGATQPHITILAIDPATPSTLYAGTNGDGLFKSTDSGGTWTKPYAGPAIHQISALAVDPTTPSTLYVGTNGQGYFKSTDSGATWADLNPSTSYFVYSLAIDPKTPSTLYVGVNGLLLKSTDSGSTWKSTNTGLLDLPIQALAMDPANRSTLYAATNGAIFKTTDAGRTWVGVYFGVLDVQALAVDPATSATVYAGGSSGFCMKSTNGGRTWTNLGGLASTTDALAIDPVTPSTLYAGTTASYLPYGVYKSVDAGATWTRANTGLTNLDVRALAIDPATPSTLYAGTYGGAFKSTDAGANWALASGGLTDLHVYALAIDPATPSTLYAGTGAGVFKSTDAGGTWAPAVNGLTSLDVRAVAVNPSNPSRLYAGTFNGGFFRSTDAGASWAVANPGLAWDAPHMPRISAFAVDSSGGTTIHAALDGGGVWQLSLSNPITVPIVLSSGGLNGSFFTSEMVLTNRGTFDVLLTYTYTAAFGGASGTAKETLATGTQKVVPDAIEYLRGLKIPVGESGNRGGTLRVDFSGAGVATVRTTTAVADGRAGLAYPGLPWQGLLSAPVYLTGLRQNVYDRSNVAVVNAGGAADGPITLRLTVVSGDPAPTPQFQVLPDVTLAPGGFSQISGILTSNGLSYTNGFVRVEKISGKALFSAYGVINDQANSDGSYVEPVPERPDLVVSRLTLPAVVETSAFTTELVLTNLGSSSRTLHFVYAASALTGGPANFDITLLPYEQQILPSFVQLLRDRGIVHDAAGPTFAGALFVTDPAGDLGDLRGVSVSARTSTPGGGGRYGLYYAAVPNASEATTEAWLFGLQQNSENRTNLALVNVGSTGGSADTFRIDVFDGATGRKAGTTDVTVPATGFAQLNAVLALLAPSVSSGYARVTRMSGINPFIAYAVINDGGNPGERSGDGAFVPMMQ